MAPVAHALVPLPRHPEPRRGSRPCVTVSNTHLTINAGGTNVSRPLGATASRTDGQRSLSLTLTVTTPQPSQYHHLPYCIYISLSISFFFFPSFKSKRKRLQFLLLLPSSSSSETLNTSDSHRDAWRGRRRIGPLP